ncbi:hypothetical protein ABZ071_32480, partial [Micromonospora fulviviridis]
MSFRRSDGPADRAESERLLDAARAGTPAEPGGDPLAYLLAAAAAPAAPAAPGGPGERTARSSTSGSSRSNRRRPASPCGPG